MKFLALASSYIVFNLFFGFHLECLEDFIADSQEVLGGSIAFLAHRNADDRLDLPWIGRHDYDTVGQHDGFLDIVGNEYGRDVLLFRDPVNIVLHLEACNGRPALRRARP